METTFNKRVIEHYKSKYSLFNGYYDQNKNRDFVLPDIEFSNMVEVCEYYAKSNPKKDCGINFEDTVFFRNLISEYFTEKLSNKMYSVHFVELYEILTKYRHFVSNLRSKKEVESFDEAIISFKKINRDLNTKTALTIDPNSYSRDVENRRKQIKIEDIYKAVMSINLTPNKEDKQRSCPYVFDAILIYFDFFLFENYCEIGKECRLLMIDSLKFFQEYLLKKEYSVSSLARELGEIRISNNLLYYYYYMLRDDIKNILSLQELMESTNYSAVESRSRCGLDYFLEICSTVCHKWSNIALERFVLDFTQITLSKMFD